MDILNWRRDALCLEYPDVDFFPTQGKSAKPAIAICSECVVMEECLEDAMEWHVNTPGIRGGYSERGRRRLSHQRLIDTENTLGEPL